MPTSKPISFLPFLLSFLLTLSLSTHQTTAETFLTPYPVSDCSNALLTGASSCPNQPGCCAGGAACCAGGCCPLTAWCVNQGSVDEGCCELGDATNCGAVLPSFAPSPCGSGSSVPKPSKQCVSVDDDWYCPPGASCGSTYGSCFGGGGGSSSDSCTTVADGGSSASPTSSSDSGSGGGSGSSSNGGGSSGAPAPGKNEGGRSSACGRGYVSSLGVLLGVQMGVWFVVVAWL